MEALEQFFSCPYCWETISMVVDTSGGQGKFVEDCEVCCHPIEIVFEVGEDEGELLRFEINKIQ